MVLEIGADLQPLADNHYAELSHQLFSGVGRTAHHAVLRTVQTCWMAGGMNLLVGLT
jgi:hypothetical protein